MLMPTLQGYLLLVALFLPIVFVGCVLALLFTLWFIGEYDLFKEGEQAMPDRYVWMYRFLLLIALVFVVLWVLLISTVYRAAGWPAALLVAALSLVLYFKTGGRL